MCNVCVCRVHLLAWRWQRQTTTLRKRSRKTRRGHVMKPLRRLSLLSALSFPWTSKHRKLRYSICVCVYDYVCVCACVCMCVYMCGYAFIRHSFVPLACISQNNLHCTCSYLIAFVCAGGCGVYRKLKIHSVVWGGNWCVSALFSWGFLGVFRVCVFFCVCFKYFEYASLVVTYITHAHSNTCRILPNVVTWMPLPTRIRCHQI